MKSISILGTLGSDCNDMGGEFEKQIPPRTNALGGLNPYVSGNSFKLCVKHLTSKIKEEDKKFRRDQEIKNNK